MKNYGGLNILKSVVFLIVIGVVSSVGFTSCSKKSSSKTACPPAPAPSPQPTLSYIPSDMVDYGDIDVEVQIKNDETTVNQANVTVILKSDGKAVRLKKADSNAQVGTSAKLAASLKCGDSTGGGVDQSFDEDEEDNNEGIYKFTDCGTLPTPGTEEIFINLTLNNKVDVDVANVGDQPDGGKEIKVVAIVEPTFVISTTSVVGGVFDDNGRPDDDGTVYFVQPQVIGQQSLDNSLGAGLSTLIDVTRAAVFSQIGYCNVVGDTCQNEQPVGAEQAGDNKAGGLEVPFLSGSNFFELTNPMSFLFEPNISVAEDDKGVHTEFKSLTTVAYSLKGGALEGLSSVRVDSTTLSDSSQYHSDATGTDDTDP